ncbi:amidohydrolase [Streptomyces violens]|uniref:amidohydrolase n=1 Tax=Streptomyces violens TaxID=66377 RepID=UPI0007C6DBE4|nr:amidohydrolase [Streptomyces violens]
MPEVPRTADPFTAADLVLLNGTVRTMDRAGTTRTALAARGGRVLAVDDDAAVRGLIGPHTRVLDLQGRCAVPGFIETHNHPTFFGLTLAADVDAGSPPNATIADIVARVEQAAADAEPGTWVRGYRYDDTLLADDRHPTRADLDPVSRDRPVCLQHVSGHFCVLNTAGLRLLGIDRNTPDPVGGAIHRDAAGEPDGVLAETAAFAAYAAMPKPETADLAEAIGLAGDAYLAAGVTTVHDTGLGLVGGPAELDAYRLARRKGRLRNRVRAYLVQDLFPGLSRGELSPVEAGVAGLGDDLFRVAGVKLWADGSLQGLTGCVSEGYACAPDKNGLLIFPQDDLSRRVATLHEAGWQVAIHGNGDGAIQAILEAYAKLGLDPLEGDRRHRIEHCQMVSERQLDQMAAAGILASFFIKHVYYWGDRHRDRFLGPERARRIDPLASAVKHGVTFGLHSDTPVVPVPPLEGIWCAVRRTTRDGHELGPEQRVDVDTALRGYTSQAAHLGFEEREKGSLEPGKLADIAVLSADPGAVAPDAVRALQVDATVIGGEVVRCGAGLDAGRAAEAGGGDGR